MVTRERVKSASWAAMLLVCAGGVAMLSFKVNAVRNEVRKAEATIVSLEKDNLYLETEFETRASQQQLAALNRMEFGYIAPGPEQFLPNERALAILAEPRGENAPEMIRVARETSVPMMQDAGFVALGDDTPDPDEPSSDEPTFQRAVVEKTKDKAAARSEPTFAALFADFAIDADEDTE